MLRTMHVLVVEDQDAIRRMIEALMTARGHTVTVASNGPRALEAALASRPDVVLLDVNLPGGLDGLEVCRRLQADPATAGVTIIMISAMDDTETRDRALAAGAVAYYTKPFSPTALLKSLDGIAKQKSE
jgi:CheY-like chemotaxis protein